MSLFQCKNQERPEKDDRKTLQKLQLIQDVQSKMECRELTARFNLDPGAYYIGECHLGRKGMFLPPIVCLSDPKCPV